jgi:hypothetical protein
MPSPENLESKPQRQHKRVHAALSVILCLGAVIAACIYGSDPFPDWPGLGQHIPLLCGFFWLIHAWARLGFRFGIGPKSRKRPPQFWILRGLEFTLLSSAIVCSEAGLLIGLRFRWSADALEKYALQITRDYALPVPVENSGWFTRSQKEEKWIGLYYVVKTEIRSDGVICFQTGTGFASDHGFAYVPQGTKPPTSCGGYGAGEHSEYFVGPWWKWSRGYAIP